MRFEGGFQGRCNKLVDGCYSFWQAGLLPLLHRALFNEGTVTPESRAHSAAFQFFCRQVCVKSGSQLPRPLLCALDL